MCTIAAVSRHIVWVSLLAPLMATGSADGHIIAYSTL